MLEACEGETVVDSLDSLPTIRSVIVKQKLYRIFFDKCT